MKVEETVGSTLRLERMIATGMNDDGSVGVFFCMARTMEGQLELELSVNRLRGTNVEAVVLPHIHGSGRALTAKDMQATLEILEAITARSERGMPTDIFGSPREVTWYIALGDDVRGQPSRGVRARCHDGRMVKLILDSMHRTASRTEVHFRIKDAAPMAGALKEFLAGCEQNV